MNEKHDHKESIFEDALKLLPERRPAFLEEACGNNSALRLRVEVLLRVHERSGDFMKEPAAPVIEDAVQTCDTVLVAGGVYATGGRAVAPTNWSIAWRLTGPLRSRA